MSAGKLAVLVIWLLCGAAFFVGDSTLATVGRWVFWILVAAHVVECAVFLPVLRKAPGSLGGNLFQTLVFGILHVQEVREAVEPAV